MWLQFWTFAQAQQELVSSLELSGRTVVTVILFATDVDLLESSSQQSLFCRGFANCVCGVRDVARGGSLSERLSMPATLGRFRV